MPTGRTQTQARTSTRSTVSLYGVASSPKPYIMSLTAHRRLSPRLGQKWEVLGCAVHSLGVPGRTVLGEQAAALQVGLRGCTPQARLSSADKCNTEARGRILSSLDFKPRVFSVMHLGPQRPCPSLHRRAPSCPQGPSCQRPPSRRRPSSRPASLLACSSQQNCSFQQNYYATAGSLVMPQPAVAGSPLGAGPALARHKVSGSSPSSTFAARALAPRRKSRVLSF